MVVRNHESTYVKCMWFAVVTANCLWGFAIILDIGMMIVSIMAYTGAQSSDDRPTIKHTFITFPPAGQHIQRLEIALVRLGWQKQWLLISLGANTSSLLQPSAGLIANPAFLIMISLPSIHVGDKHIRSRAQRLRRRFWQPLLWHIACLGGWATSVALQARYVPVLGTGKLPECVEYGDELSQCGMVSASWALAMVYW